MAEKMDLNEKFVLTPDEAAVYIGVGVNQIRSLCSDGQIKATRVGRKWKIPKPCMISCAEHRSRSWRAEIRSSQPRCLPRY